MSIVEPFRELESQLVLRERQWASGGASDDGVAHDLTRLLSESPVASVDPGLLLAELVADPRSWPGQSWESLFGNASITVIRTASVRVDVLYWLQNGSTLHKHVSPGAFMALGGRRLHQSYEYGGEDLTCGVSIGRLTQLTRTMMHDESVSPITPTTVHELFWIEKPSVTVSVRCEPELTGSTAHRPHEFIPPNVSYLPAAFQEMSNVERWLGGLRILRMANRSLYQQSLANALTIVDPTHVMHVLIEICDDPLDDVAALLDHAHSTRADDVIAQLRPTIPELRRRKLFSAARPRDINGMLLAALLWSGAEGEDLTTLLKGEGISDPGAFLADHGEQLTVADPRTQPYVMAATESVR